MSPRQQDARRSIGVGDGSAPLLSGGVAFAALLLAAQVPPQVAAFALVGIDAPIERFMADRKLSRDLLGTMLQTQTRLRLGPDVGGNLRRIAAMYRTCLRYALRLLWPVAA